jgi:hypothetical protein
MKALRDIVCSVGGGFRSLAGSITPTLAVEPRTSKSRGSHLRRAVERSNALSLGKDNLEVQWMDVAVNIESMLML